MSLKSLLALVDDKLEELFHRKTPDSKKVRIKALKAIATARRQFGSVTPTKGKKMWKTSNEVVAFSPGYKISGKGTSYIPVSRFEDFLSNLEKAITGGELDNVLITDGETTAATSAPRTRKSPGPMSAETKAKIAATRAANKAKKK